MDEKALQDIFRYAVSNGYRGDINQFKNLLSSDSAALDDVYNYAISNGYSKPLDDFKGLIGISAGVKKKEVSDLSLGQDTSSSATPEMEAPTPSESSPKIKNPSRQNPKIDQSDYNNFFNISRGVYDAIDKGDKQAVAQGLKDLKYIYDMYGDVARSDKNMSDDYNTLIKNAKSSIDGFDSQTLNITPVGEKTKSTEVLESLGKEKVREPIFKPSDIELTDEENNAIETAINAQYDEYGNYKVDMNEVEQELEDEFSEDGVWDSLIKMFRTTAGAQAPIFYKQLATLKTSKEKAIAKVALDLQSKGIDPSSPEAIEIAKDQRRQEIINQKEYENVEDYFENQSFLFKTEEQEKTEKGLESATNKYIAHKKKFLEKAQELENAGAVIDKYIQKVKDGEDLTAGDIVDLNNSYVKATLIASEIQDNYKNIENDISAIGGFQEELDRFKRNHTYLTTGAASIGKFSVDLVGGMSSIIGMQQEIAKDLMGLDLYGIDIYNPYLEFGEYMKGVSDGISESISRSKSLDNINSAGDFAEWTGRLFVDQAPQLLMAYFTGGASIGLMGASAAGNKYIELKDDKSYNDMQKYIAAYGVGAAEALSEKIELDVINSAFPSKRMAKAASKDMGEEAFKNAMKSGMKKTLEKSAAFASNVNKEGISELVAQLGSNLVDKYVLDKKDVGLLDGVAEAYLSGAVIGGGMVAAPAITSRVLAPFVNDPMKNVQKNLSKIQELQKAYEFATKNEDKEFIKSQIEKLKSKNSDIIQKGMSALNNLTPEEIREGVDVVEKIIDLKSKYKSIKENNAIPESSKKVLLSEIDEEYNTLVEKRKQLLDKAYAVQEQTTSEVPLQPEAPVGEEVAEGKPETEPKITAKEGQKEIVSGVEITYPTAKQAEERKSERNKPEYVEASSENLQEEDVDMLKEDLSGEFGLLTAENPMAQPLTEEENSKLNEKAEAWLRERGYNPRRVTGKYDQAENSFFVKGLTKEDAIAFAKEFNQESVAHSEGLIYQDGSMNPRVKSSDNFSFEEYTPESNYVSVVKTKDGLKTFSIGYDFETKTKPTEQQQKLAEEQRTQAPVQGSKLRQNIQKAVEKVFGKFETKSFKNGKEMADYARKNFNQEVGLDESARMFYDNGDLIVLVNEELADDTSFGHEIWHGILLKAFGDNQVLFRQFRDEVDAALREAGYDVIADRLDAFAEQYAKTGLMAEEWLVQLGGMLTSARIDPKNLKRKQKTLLQKLKDIVNKFAIEITGQPVFLEDAKAEDILSFMTTMSDMMSKGEDISGFFTDTEGRDSKTRAQVVGAFSGQLEEMGISVGTTNKKTGKTKVTNFDIASSLNEYYNKTYGKIDPNDFSKKAVDAVSEYATTEMLFALSEFGDNSGKGWYTEDYSKALDTLSYLDESIKNDPKIKEVATAIIAVASNSSDVYTNLTRLIYGLDGFKSSNAVPLDVGTGKGASAIAAGIKRYNQLLEKFDNDPTKVASFMQQIDTISNLKKKLLSEFGLNSYAQALKENLATNPEWNENETLPMSVLIFGPKIGAFYSNLSGLDGTPTIDRWCIRTIYRYKGDMRAKVSSKEMNAFMEENKIVGASESDALSLAEEHAKLFNAILSGKGEYKGLEKSKRNEMLKPYRKGSQIWEKAKGVVNDISEGADDTVKNKSQYGKDFRSFTKEVFEKARDMVADKAGIKLSVSDVQAILWIYEKNLFGHLGVKQREDSTYSSAANSLVSKVQSGALTVDMLKSGDLKALSTPDIETEGPMGDKFGSDATSYKEGIDGRQKRSEKGVDIKTRAQKVIPDDVMSQLTEDENGNIVFMHFSDEKRDYIRPSSGERGLTTSREESQAISSVGGLAMFYVQEGQKEANVGNVANTVLVPKEKVYYFNSDPLNFYDEARRQFQEHMNRGKDKKTDFAFNPNYQVAWITKVANENGFDIVVSKWRGDKDFRAQTTERLATEDKVTEFKRSMNKIEVGDKILIQGKEAIVTQEDTRLNRMIYEYKDSNGDVITGYFVDSPMSRIKPELIEKGPITRAQKVNVYGIQGYERMQSNIDSIIEKARRRGADKNRIYEDALNYMQKSATYERATDVQREQLVRDLRKKLGIRQKSAPKADRILGNIKDATKITVNEKSALKDMIRRQAKAAKTAIAAYRSVAKILVKEIKDLQTIGKISVRQMTSVLRRFEATDMLNPDAVSRFVDYMAKVFNDAAYFERISKINNKIRTARKNANKKLGIVEDLRPLIEKVLSINPTLIPDNVFDIYEEMVMMLSERASVLSLQEIEDVKSKFSKISDEISEQESRVNELYDIFESFKDKVVDDSGKVDYAATIAKMQDEGIIMSEDAELMKKYKAQILGISERSKRSDEEIEEERQENIEAVKQSDIFAGRLTMRDERNLAQAIRDIMKDDRVLQRMSAKDVADLLKIIDNINNGYIPSYAQILYEKMEAKLAVANSVESIKKAKILPIERIISKIKSLFTGRTAQLEAIRRNPLIYIDQVLGNFKGTQVFDAFLDKVARAHSKYTSELNEANTILENAEAKLFNSLGRNPNKLLRSKFKMMAYLIQMEHESNPGNKESSVTAMEFLRETIKQAELGDIIYGDIEAGMLLDIIDKFTTNDQIDVSKIEKSFTKEEKASIEAIRKVNDSISDKAVYTAGVIRGENIKPRTNYIHLHVISQSKKSDKEVGVKLSQEANSRMRPSTRGKSLIQREGVASALNFDPFASTARGAKFTLLDYHMTAPVRTVRRLFNEMDNELEGESRETRKVFRAIRESVEEALTNTLTNDFEITSFADDVMNELQKAGYATMLAGIPRATSEFLSNATYVLVTDPDVFTKASKYFSVMNTADGINVLRNVNSKQAERIYPTHTLSGRMIDTSVLNNAVGLKTSNAKNKISNVMSIIYNYSLKPTRSAAEFVSESLISTPDKSIMRPLWFVKFAEEFKKIANVETDFEKISQNNEAYMAKYKEAIKSASAVADDVTVKAGASDNAFTGILKGKVKSNMSTTMKFFNRFNNFMQRFMIYEYTTARTGIHALVGNGTISKSQGARLMAGVTLRMIAYNFLIGVLGKAFYGLFPDGEDEEDKDTLLQEAGQATASALTGLILGRNIGNVPKSIINIGIEEVNKEYFDFLRTGEYDPYDDAIAYTITPKNQKKYQQTGVWPYLQGMSGAFSPILRTADFSIKKIDKYMEEPTLDRYGRPKDMTKSQIEARKRLDIEKYRIMGEVAGNLGFIPLYKDIRKVALNMMYKDLKSKKTDRYGRPTEN